MAEQWDRLLPASAADPADLLAAAGADRMAGHGERAAELGEQAHRRADTASEAAHRASGRIDFDKNTQRFDRSAIHRLLNLADPHRQTRISAR